MIIVIIRLFKQQMNLKWRNLYKH